MRHLLSSLKFAFTLFIGHFLIFLRVKSVIITFCLISVCKSDFRFAHNQHIATFQPDISVRDNDLLSSLDHDH